MFFMMDMGLLNFYLGIKIIQDASCIKLSQAKYARDLRERFHMKKYKSSLNPFISRFRLEDDGDTALVENTL
jgi:hypothetical protein